MLGISCPEYPMMKFSFLLGFVALMRVGLVQIHRNNYHTVPRVSGAVWWGVQHPLNIVPLAGNVPIGIRDSAP